MRKIIFLLCLSFLSVGIYAQSDSVIKKNIINTKTLPRSNDHFMLQLGYLSWNNKPDSIQTTGFPRTFNVYFLFDFPFKTSPKFSAAIGAGFGTDHMFFQKTDVGIADNTPSIRFTNTKDTNSFKKNKLAVAYLEAPVELRYSSNPDNDRRSLKFAVGVKVGTLLSAHVKGKNLRDRSGKTVNEYKMKEYSKQFLNKNRLALTGRFGFGHYSLFGSYQVTALFKEGQGPKVNPASVGLTISGL
ncbi:MAG: outer membrane beta-barrel protein [Chitinophagaceae bacterium]